MMGGRGTFASGNSVAYNYETVGKIEGVKVLKGTGNLHDLPVEAHSSKAYIKLHPDGRFSMMRFYDRNLYLVKEIAYHPEAHLDKSRKPILHIHEYEPGNLNNRRKRLLTEQEYEKYKKYFVGGLRWKVDE